VGGNVTAQSIISFFIGNVRTNAGFAFLFTLFYDRFASPFSRLRARCACGFYAGVPLWHTSVRSILYPSSNNNRDRATTLGGTCQSQNIFAHDHRHASI
jgi:hypothetical protein